MCSVDSSHLGYGNIPSIKINHTDHEMTRHLILASEEIARPFLASARSVRSSVSTQGRGIPLITSRVPAVVIDARRYFSPDFHYSDRSGEKEKSKRSDCERLCLFLFGAAFTGMSAYFFGKSIAKNEEAQEKRESFEQLLKCWGQNRYTYIANHQHAYVSEVDTVIARANAILKRQKADRFYNIAFIVNMMATGALWAGGALIGGTSTMAMLAPGLVVGSVAAILMLGRYGYRSFSTKDQRDAKEIQKNIAALNEQEKNLSISYPVTYGPGGIPPEA